MANKKKSDESKFLLLALLGIGGYAIGKNSISLSPPCNNFLNIVVENLGIKYGYTLEEKSNLILTEYTIRVILWNSTKNNINLKKFNCTVYYKNNAFATFNIDYKNFVLMPYNNKLDKCDGILTSNANIILANVFPHYLPPLDYAGMFTYIGSLTFDNSVINFNIIDNSNES